MQRFNVLCPSILMEEGDTSYGRITNPNGQRFEIIDIVSYD
jgi:hypothetical protein